MRIGLDFDGVLSDCGHLKEVAALELYGVVIPRGNFKKELVVGSGLLTMDQYRRLQDAIYGTREYGLRMEPVPGMLEHLPRLLAAGHEAHVITSRDGVMLDIAHEWLERHGLDLPMTGLGYAVSKAEASAGCGVFLDDDLEKLRPLTGVVPHRFLYSWGYNGHVETGSVARRVSSWAEFSGTVAALASERAPAR